MRTFFILPSPPCQDVAKSLVPLLAAKHIAPRVYQVNNQLTIPFADFAPERAEMSKRGSNFLKTIQ
jgi:hypothetical protein